MEVAVKLINTATDIDAGKISLVLYELCQKKVK